MSNETNNYRQDYDSFVRNFEANSTTGLEVGENISRMVQHYCTINQEVARAHKLYNQVLADLSTSRDENDKPMSAAKAKILADASPEGALYLDKKSDLENIDQIVNGLKYLQKGVLNEYANIGNQ